MNNDFISACANGDLNKVQQLLQLNPNINISENNNYPFQTACTNGHLHVAQWLLQVKPDIIISANIILYGLKNFNYNLSPILIDLICNAF